MGFVQALNILFVVINIYQFCYGQIRKWGINIGVVDRILLNFDRTAGLFRSILWTKPFAVMFLILSCLGTEGVKEEKITWQKITTPLATEGVLFFFSWWLLGLPLTAMANTAFYILTLSAGYTRLLMGGMWVSRLLKNSFMDNPFNDEDEPLQQETRLVKNEYSINPSMKFYYDRQRNNGFVNVVNPQRACVCTGSSGSGKSHCVINQPIRQQIEEGYIQYIYDYKFPGLLEIAYNHLPNHQRGYKKIPTFYAINLDGPRHSHRCSPVHPDFMADISGAYESAYTITLNLDRSWVQKQGGFFVESPIILFVVVIWFLHIYNNGRYCTFPHAIEFLSKRYEGIFPILISYPEFESYLSPLVDARLGGVQGQLQGQIALAKILLSRMASSQLYWVMSGNDFTLDTNSPDDPEILCVGNNPDRQNIYGAALGLYNSRIVRLINKKGRLEPDIIIDESLTVYFRGFDNLIAAVRSNKVAVLLYFQNSSQLGRDYRDKEATVVMDTVGSVSSGQVVDETAKTLLERSGRVLQKWRSMALNHSDELISISVQLDSLIPTSKISTLMQGMFVGVVTDNFDECIEQKIFYCEIVVDSEKVKTETARYKKIPQITDFTDKSGAGRMKQVVQENYERIKTEAGYIVAEELERIKNDPALRKLLPEQNWINTSTP